MGQAKRRGSFEYRKHLAITKKEEQRRIYREAWLQRQAELDAILDRDYTPPRVTEPREISVGTGGFGSGGRRRPSMMLMAAMLAATAGIGPVMADGRKCR